LEGDGKRFLLSAKQFGNSFLISTYEDFPVMVDTKPKRGFIARVDQKKDLSFLVSLNHCHYCDEKLGYFTCGRQPDEREVIAKIVHSVRKYNVINTEFRCLSLTIPVISDSGMRKVWCPRSFRRIEPSIPTSSDLNDCLFRCPAMGARFVNKLPEWNAKSNSLVLKFQGERILTASAKNYLLYDERYAKFDFAESQVRQSAERKQQQAATAAVTSKESFGSALASRLGGGSKKEDTGVADLEAVVARGVGKANTSSSRREAGSELDEDGRRTSRKHRSSGRSSSSSSTTATSSRHRHRSEESIDDSVPVATATANSTTSSSTSSRVPRVPSLKLVETQKTISPMNSHRSSDGSSSICTSLSPPNTGRSTGGAAGGLNSSNNTPRKEHRASSSRRTKRPPRPRDAGE
jgi:hypothetical protein